MEGSPIRTSKCTLCFHASNSRCPWQIRSDLPGRHLDFLKKRSRTYGTYGTYQSRVGKLTTESQSKQVLFRRRESGIRRLRGLKGRTEYGRREDQSNPEMAYPKHGIGRPHVPRARWLL